MTKRSRPLCRQDALTLVHTVLLDMSVNMQAVLI